MIELKDIINTMVSVSLALAWFGKLATDFCVCLPLQVDRLALFAVEVERVSLEVGTEGSVRELELFVFSLLRPELTLVSFAASFALQKARRVRSRLWLRCGGTGRTRASHELTKLSLFLVYSSRQAVVEDVQGTWRELTSVVNKLAANLTSQVRAIAKVTKVRLAFLFPLRHVTLLSLTFRLDSLSSCRLGCRSRR